MGVGHHANQVHNSLFFTHSFFRDRFTPTLVKIAIYFNVLMGFLFNPNYWYASLRLSGIAYSTHRLSAAKHAGLNT